MIKQLTGEYVNLIVKEFFTVHRTVRPHVWFQHNSGTAHIIFYFQAALVGVKSTIFGQRYITFSTTSILYFNPLSSA